MPDDIVTRLREPNAGVCSNDWARMKNAMDEAADEIERLRGLVAELMPFMVNDAMSGIEMGPAPLGHEDSCDDCLWYEESKKWSERIRSGEFDQYVPNLSKI